MRVFCMGCLQSFQSDNELESHIFVCDRLDNPIMPKVEFKLTMAEALTGLVDGKFELVRPVKWRTIDEPENGPYGVVRYAPGYGNFRRNWPYNRDFRNSLPLIVDDIDIVTGYWEVVAPEDFYKESGDN